MSTHHLNQRELAERLNISARTLERWRWIGEGPRFLKLGGRVVYRLEDIEAYEAEQLRDSTTGPTPLQPARSLPGLLRVIATSDRGETVHPFRPMHGIGVRLRWAAPRP